MAKKMSKAKMAAAARRRIEKKVADKKTKGKKKGNLFSNAANGSY